MGTQHLGDDEHQIGGSDAFEQLSGELEAHDLGEEHVDRLTDHHGLSLDPSDAPADHAKAVDHRCVAVRSHKRVGMEYAIGIPDDLRKVLEIHLMDDASRRWHN
jgi:hypothetical protein